MYVVLTQELISIRSMLTKLQGSPMRLPIGYKCVLVQTEKIHTQDAQEISHVTE